MEKWFETERFTDKFLREFEKNCRKLSEISGGYKLKNKLCVFVLSVCFLFICSCAAQKPTPPEWVYGPEEITLTLQNDGQLNVMEGMPHTLLLCVYQLKDPNTFNQMSEDIRRDSATFLECELYDGSVASAKKIIAYPGQNQTFLLDRAEGAKYVAIVAGYYLLEKERVVRVFDIPVVIDKKGFFKRTLTTKPAPLKLVITLGSKQIQMVEGNSSKWKDLYFGIKASFFSPSICS